MSASTLMLEGPAGPLEARLDRAANERGAALLCHPHPLYGGSMDDLVLATAADALLAAGISCLRFNFRGVGASAGSFDDGRGEAEDVRAAFDALQAHTGQLPCLLGYSFGSWAAWRAVRQGLTPAVLILIAPPVTAMDFSGTIDASPRPGHVIVGDSDPFAPLDNVRDWATTAAATLQVLAGADHFFQTALPDLQATVTDIVAGI